MILPFTTSNSKDLPKMLLKPALAALVALSSCATAKDSTLLGIGIGSVVGSAFGALAGRTHGNPAAAIAAGAAFGGALGGLGGYTKFKEHEKNDSLKLSPLRSEAPSVSKPELRRVWVPPRIDGDQYISGHWIFIIEKNASWVRP
jgi:hypothetical protein